MNFLSGQRRAAQPAKGSRQKRFDRHEYFRSLEREERTGARAPGAGSRRAFVLGFTSFFGFSVTAMAAWPRRLYDVDIAQLRGIADINETISSSQTVALIRTPTFKPPYSAASSETPVLARGNAGRAIAGEVVASSAELAELEDAEADVQGPALTAEQMDIARTLAEASGVADPEGLVASLGNPLDDAINQLVQSGGNESSAAEIPVDKTLPPAIAGLATRSKPTPPPTAVPIELPVRPKSKARAPLSLASLSSPEDSSTPAKSSSSSPSSAPSSPSPKTPASNSSGGGTRTLRLFNTHTGDELTATYKRNGKYVDSELKRLNWLMRDRRNNQTRKIDPKLYDALFETTARLGAEGRRINVLSGYRSKSTNDALRRKSRGVAKNSYHTLGRAIDFTIPGYKISSIHKNALQTNAGGVGYYPSSNFVHMDTGPIRAWPSRYNYIAKRYQKST